MADQPQDPRRRERRHTRRPKRRRPFWRWFWGTVLLIGTATAVTAGIIVYRYVHDAPNVTALTLESSTIIRDAQGNEIYRVHAGKNRTPVALEKVPRDAQDAFVAIEDPRFREHFGVDIKGILRAVFKTGLYMLHLPGGQVQGGSTITQQLARDLWLSQEVSLKRKVQEWWVAVQMERVYTKDEILEMYLNQIYYGHGAYGIEAAATAYFGKDVKDLTLAEGAQLAGVVNGPSIYDPVYEAQASINRRNLVLQAMHEQGFITAAEMEKAKVEQPKLVQRQANEEEETPEEAPAGNYFTDYVLAVLSDTKSGVAAKYGINVAKLGNIGTAGLQIYTSFDPALQSLAEQAVRDQMNAADKKYGLTGKATKPEAAMVVMNPKTGEVKALVGGRKRKAILEFNRATDALRQPGSAIKPVVAYTPALDAGLSPATVLDDAPVMLSNDKSTVWPQNFDFRYEGLVSMRRGVEQSLNPVAVRALQKAGGPSKGLNLGRKFGLTTLQDDDNNLALALGGLSQGVTPLAMTEAYTVLANLGQKVDPVVITKIVSRDGAVLFEAKPKKEQLVRPAVAYLMVDIMKGTIKRGTAYGYTSGFNGWPSAGKTGTTENNRDAWFLGFTPDLVATVWNGYDDPTNTLKWTGAFVPVQIWNQFMRAAVKKAPADWPRPADVTNVAVCRKSGALPNALCPSGGTVTELFVKGTEPKNAGHILVAAQVVQERVGTATKWVNWQLGCPSIPVNRVFIKRPEPYARHPTDPNNPIYLPADRVEEVPTEICTKGALWEKLFPDKKGAPKAKPKPDTNGNGVQETPEEENPTPTQPDVPPTNPPPETAPPSEPAARGAKPKQRAKGDPFLGGLMRLKRKQLLSSP
ncbi:MAG TPA: PBP1A family penicillin-binding protein [Symbiobacteriaceae bacterium]|nr:PBP1A family penicillin-binding protein [Symbiobacteriaceae bacterium]